MRKDKEKVLDEVWTEDRIRGFLDVRSYDATAEDFHMLLKAYQSMRAEDFEIFVNMFTEAGRSVDATDPTGRTVLSIVAEHHHGGPYAEILEKASAA